MKRRIKYYRLIWFKHDLPAGLSVFLVALPLCLGIALASGAPLYSGLVSGIIGGLVVSLISGSQLGVSGPAAGLSTIVAATIIAAGDFKVFLLSVIVAGIFQLCLGLLKLGVIANYFPSSVIKGMLAAIGIILISKQIPIAIGYDQPDFWTSGFLKIFITQNHFGDFNSFFHHSSISVVIISFVSIGIMLLMQQKEIFKNKLIPAALVVVIIGILLNYLLFKIDFNFALKPSQLVFIPNNIFQDIRFPDLSKLFSSIEIWKNGIVIGILATLESLLCTEAIDKLDKRNRITPVNRELIAQGIGNILCGLLSAIPITAVVVRGAANVDAGARTKLSAFTHGLFILITVLFVPFLLSKIPFASLSAVLLVTGYNLTKPKLYKNMWSLGKKQFIPFLITILVILSTDLLIGVSIGLLISIFYIIQNNFKTEYKIVSYQQHETAVVTLKLNSNVTFLNKVQLKKSLDQVPEYSMLTIDGSDCNFIDYDVLEIISEYANKAHDRHIELVLKGIQRVNVTAVH